MTSFVPYLKVSSIILPLFFLLHPLWFEPDQASLDPPAFEFLTQDSVEVAVYPLYDSEKRLDQYQARIFTPICEDTICYSVELDFYWDLLGNFIEYKLLPGKPLTKVEHDPFEEEDYQKLGAILRNKQPAFVNMRKEELITKVSNDQVDGITGATVAAIKDEIVPGAAYSCYTLWHIAHGVVMNGILQHTASQLDTPLVRKLSALEDENAHFFLFNNFKGSDFSKYLPELLYMIGKNGSYFAKQAIEKLPIELLSNHEVQDFFAEHFNQIGYFAQVSLLKQLKGQAINDNFAKTLIHNLDDRGSSQNEAIIALFVSNSNQLGPDRIRHFLERAGHMQVRLSDLSYEAIISLSKSDPTLKKEIKSFKKKYKSTLRK